DHLAAARQIPIELLRHLGRIGAWRQPDAHERRAVGVPFAQQLIHRTFRHDDRTVVHNVGADGHRADHEHLPENAAIVGWTRDGYLLATLGLRGKIAKIGARVAVEQNAARDAELVKTI